MSKLSSGREREAKLIRRAKCAAAVGRLMLGELHTWDQFHVADIVDLISLPRRNLKAARVDCKKRLSPEIEDFCSKNFHEMDERKLSLLYEEIKAYQGLELPLSEFEKSFRLSAVKFSKAILPIQRFLFLCGDYSLSFLKKNLLKT